MDSVLHLGKEAKESSLKIFFKMNCVLLLCATSCWILATNSKLAARYFQEKDDRTRMLQEGGRNDSSKDEKDYMQVFGVEDRNATESYSFKSNQDIETNVHDQFPYQSVTNPLNQTNEEEDSEAAKMEESDSLLGEYQQPSSTQYGLASSSNKRAHMDLSEKRGLLAFFYSSVRYVFPSFVSMAEQDAVWPLCLTLVITIWSSIFTAAFFAYVNSTNGRDIEQTLYFTRLFCDLIGRPLTFLPRPLIVKSPSGLLTVAFLRACLSAIFFMYTFIPGMPQ